MAKEGILGLGILKRPEGGSNPGVLGLGIMSGVQEKVSKILKR